MLTVYWDGYHNLITFTKVGVLAYDIDVDKGRITIYNTEAFGEYTPDYWDKYIGTLPEGLI